jgi:hypothetical protein
MNQAELEATNAKLGRVTRETLGHKLTAENLHTLTAQEASALRKALSAHAEFRELALEQGSAFAQANIFLNARENGVDLDFGDIVRMANGLEPLPTDDEVPDLSQALDPAAAQARLSQLSRDPEWAARALRNGTAEALENLQLNFAITGASISHLDTQRFAHGHGPAAAVAPDLTWEPPTSPV